MTRQISEMQKADVIESSEDPYYNSPAFLVTKKNGQKRLVIDLRGTNSLLRPKSVQLPTIDDLLQDITSKRPVFLTTIDISSAAWTENPGNIRPSQVQMADDGSLSDVLLVCPEAPVNSY